MNYLSRLSSLSLWAVTLAGCGGSLQHYQGNQKKDNISPQAVEEMKCPVVKVEVERTLEMKIGDTLLSRTFSGPAGSGFAVYDDESKKSYVFTARHVISNREFLTFLGPATVTVKKVSVNGYAAQPVHNNKLYDAGLLEIQGGNLPCHFTGKLAKKVEIGDQIAIVGHPAGEEKSLSLGYLASKDKGHGDYLDIYEIFGVPKYAVVDAPIAPGSSGSPMYVFQGGKPYLAGMVQIIYDNKPGAGVMPLEALQRFVKGTPLNDELLEE